MIDTTENRSKIQVLYNLTLWFLQTVKSQITFCPAVLLMIVYTRSLLHLRFADEFFYDTNLLPGNTVKVHFFT